MRKKDILKLMLAMSGITALKWRRLVTGLYVFNYHRIGNPLECEYNRDLYSCSAAQLRSHVTFLRENFEVVNCERLLHTLEHGNRQERPLALITFDDGYADNYTLAFPILRELGVPATFFLPTAYIGQSRLMWGDEIAWILRHSRHEAISLPEVAESFSLKEPDLERSIRSVLRHAKKMRRPFAESIEQIRKACGGIDSPHKTHWPQFLNWDQVKEMLSAGMDIGSHTHVHELLARLPGSAQTEELVSSKNILEDKLQSRILAVAYPVGGKTAYTAETCQLAREAGYRLGFSFLRRANPFPVEDTLNIGRFAIDDDMNALSVKSMACFPRIFAN